MAFELEKNLHTRNAPSSRDMAMGLTSVLAIVVFPYFMDVTLILTGLFGNLDATARR
jgi:hypothetical protein